MNTFSQGQNDRMLAQWDLYRASELRVGPGCSVNTDCPASSIPQGAHCLDGTYITDAPTAPCNDGDSAPVLMPA
jgi:hypothetical protein